ncbi:MAG: hypothetical protein H0W74_10335 [Sphingosinicella sp.]|nr:hypothetical protein [Sphingosinicella sp.]
MRQYWTNAVLALIALTAGQPLQACLISVPLKLEDIQYADLVVTGRISGYRIIPDMEARRRQQELPPRLRQYLTNQDSFLGDYARFDIVVDEVWLGNAPKALTVTWQNSTFALPSTMPEGRYLFGLRNPKSQAPPLRGPSAVFMPNPAPEFLALLQAPCAAPFMFEIDSDRAAAIRQILSKSE